MHAEDKHGLTPSLIEANIAPGISAGLVSCYACQLLLSWGMWGGGKGNGGQGKQHHQASITCICPCFQSSSHKPPDVFLRGSLTGAGA